MDTPAKINLLLRITGKTLCNEAVYHLLETIFWPLPTLCDTVEIKCSRVRTGKDPRIALTCNLQEIPVDEGNLCCKAARLFLQETQIAANADITLTKRIPVAAGLGGGSSDAAATLLELWTLLTGNDSTVYAKLPAMAAKLGADVPFFLKPIPSLATGIGDNLTPLKVGNTRDFPRILLIHPLFPISAKWAYQQWDLLHPKEAMQRPDSQVSGLIKEGRWTEMAHAVENDLEEILFHKFPLLEMIQRSLLREGALTVHLSGSGPTMFALLPAETNEKSQIFLNLQKEFPQYGLYLI